MSSLNYSEFCRLCLVKERVSTPIFEGEGDVRRIFLKIATCLPIKVSREDHLPKSICDDCLYKVENQYQFWNTTANSEKQLHQWLGSTPGDSIDVKNVHASGMDPMEMKQESMDMDQGSELSKSLSRVEAVIAEEAGRVAAAAHGEDEDEEEEESEEEGSNSEESEDDDNDADEPNKEDDDEDEAYDEELEPTTFVNVSLACDEAGPSGTQQTSVAPSTSTSAPAASGSEISTIPWTPGIPLESASESKTELHGPGIKGAITRYLVLVKDDNEVPPLVPFSKVKKCLGTSKRLDSKTKILEKEVVKKSSGFHKSSLELQVKTEGVPIMSGKESVKSGKNMSMFSKSSCRTKAGKSLVEYEYEPFKCNICGKEYQTNSILERHKVTHSNDRPFTCDVCSKKFKRLYELKTHTKIHTKERNYVCDICGHNFTQSSHLQIHRNRHLGAYKLKCESCNKGFHTNVELQVHNNMHHGGNQFICKVCGKVYAKKMSYMKHVKTHEPGFVLERKNQCETCGKTFAVKSGLRLHMLSHTGGNRFDCDVCGKVLNSRVSWRSHKFIHTGELPYVCEQCGKRFRGRANLSVHMRIHTGERPFSCDQCNKTFTQRSTLILHERYHTGLRPYQCDVCTKGFISKTSLNIHHRTKHEDELYINSIEQTGLL